jgi:hypothetical protein
MAVYCHECGSNNIRASRVRLADLLHLLEFQYPVRCYRCKRRWYAPLLSTLSLPRSTHGRRKVPKTS